MRTGITRALGVGALLLAFITVSAKHTGADTVLVPAGSDWVYLDDGTDQGVAWREAGFPDTAWAEGSAQLGYGDGDEATVVGYGPDPNNKYVTTYFRHEFEVADPSGFACLRLHLLRDDGGVVYLNGAEMQRSNMPAGSVDYLTLAASTVGSAQEDAFQVSYALAEGLVAGTNVLAVEIHQVSRTSSDISFDLELVGLSGMPALMRKAPYLVFGGDNTEMDVHWQLILSDTCTVEWGDDLTYSLGSSQTLEYGADHQHTYTITGLTPGTQYCYRVTAGGQEYTGYFRAAPPGDAISVRFFAYGDTRTYPADHDAVAEAMVSRYTADPGFRTFVLSVGDLVSHGDDESDWDTEFFDPSYPNLKHMLGQLAYQSAMGNHEESGVLFTKYFPYPFVSGRYWSFDYGPVHFTVVDQYSSYGPGSAQLDWIETDLASTAKPWKILYLHEPGWSAGGHSNNTNVQNYIQPLCEQYDVPMLFAGHNHYYARAVVNGVQHITTGGGGAPLYDPNPTYPNVVASAKAYHVCIVEIDGGSLHFEALTPAGVLLDSLTMSLPGAGMGPEIGRPGMPLEPAAGDPNPFREWTSVDFSVPEPSQVLLNIFDAEGRRLRTLVDATLPRGRWNSVWDGRDDVGRPLAPGVYFSRLRIGDRCRASKLILLR